MRSLRPCYRFVSLSVFFALFLASSAAHSQQQLNVMFYNVYNLFDNQKDAGKDDWTWLPSSYPGKKKQCDKLSTPHYRKACHDTNWTDQHLTLKISQLRTAITGNQRSNVPDILGLCEVENLNVTRMLAQSMGYDPRAVVVTNSPDVRGIDVALIYKPSAALRYRSHQEYVISSSPDLLTRNILEVEFIVNGQEQLFVYVNHWPSQGKPSSARYLAAGVLRKAIDARLRANPKANIIAMGDFNTITTDRPHAINDGLLKPSSLPTGQLFDVHDTFMRHPQIPSDVKKLFPNGTYYYTYGKQWNMLDRFIVNKNLFDGKGLDFAINTYRIHSPNFLTRPWELRDGSNQSILIPYRANHSTLDPKYAGYSDHFAIRGSFTIK